MPRQQLDKLGLNITYQEGLPEKYGNALGEPSLIISDDLLNEVYSRDICDLFTKGSNHRNISVLILTQNLFHQGTNCLLGTSSISRRQSQPLRSISGRDTSAARISDTRQDTDDTLRFRTNIFPDEGSPIVYAPVNDETHKVQLPQVTHR